MSRKGIVFFHEKKAGIIEENEYGVSFRYDSDYLAQPEARPISLTFPLQSEPFTHEIMLPFFDGLIPEGWMLDIAQKSWKIDIRDRMGLLLACCKDCIGAVSIEPFSA